MSSELTNVNALLEEARLAAKMPPPAERLRLRTAAGLSRTQVAKAVGVGRQTVANWETGASDPTPPARLEYLRLLDGLAALHPAAQDAGPAAAEPADEIPAALATTPPPPLRRRCRRRVRQPRRPVPPRTGSRPHGASGPRPAPTATRPR